jgi:hypothetical protein
VRTREVGYQRPARYLWTAEAAFALGNTYVFAFEQFFLTF